MGRDHGVAAGRTAIKVAMMQAPDVPGIAAQNPGDVGETRRVSETAPKAACW